MLVTTEVAMSTKRASVSFHRNFQLSWMLSVLLLLAASPLSRGQNPPQPPPQQPDQATPDAGGPGGDTGTIALPKKKEKGEEPPPAAPVAPKVKNPAGMSNFSLRVEVPEVTVDVGVLVEKNHQFVSGLKPGNFRIYENGVLQKVAGFKRIEAPITALLLCEFSGSMYSWVNHDMRDAAYSFAQQLRPQDYVALMTFDMNTHIVMDFSQDKNLLLQAIGSLIVPSFNERNLFDALYESLDRLNRIEGRKYIIVLASGRDTFSKLNFDKILQKVKGTPDVTIYTISTGGQVRAITEGRSGGMNGQLRDMDNLMADNEMKTFSSATGGMSYFPRFTGELPDIFGEINQNIRAKYQLVYHPSNPKQDGTYRKLRVELVDEEGQPLRIQDEKKKPLKYDVIARDGYKARQEVE